MTANQFQQVIGRSESETLDFKADSYDLSNSRNKFVKDVVAMANTPRDHAAHIVLGVRWTPESGSDVVGANRQLDDTTLQDAFGDCAVQPALRFTYTPLRFAEKQVGVIEIPVQMDGPYTLVKDYVGRTQGAGNTSRDEGLQAGAIYYRRGTQNSRAAGSELKRVINWFKNREVHLPDPVRFHWNQFIQAVHHFEPGVTYVLAVDRVPSKIAAPVSALGLAPWRAVIDFDPASENSGLMSCIADTLSRHRVINRVVRGEYQIQPGTHWFFARGLSGRQATLSTGNHRAWLQVYKQELGRQLERLSGVVSPSPVMALVLWSDVGLQNHLRTLMEELYGAFRDTVEIVVVAGNDEPSFEALAEDLGAKCVPMNLRSVCNGIAVHFADLSGEDNDRCVLPSTSGASIEVASTDWLWLREDIELLHRSAGLSGDDDATDYRIGADISWRNLHLRHDCDRDITPNIRNQVEIDLQRRQTVRVNLYHDPGSGGTTVGRRVAWDLHDAFPVGIMLRCVPRDTARRIAKIAALTESSVLIIVDGGQHSDREIDDLYEFVKADHTPVVLLQVLRRFRSPEVDGRRQFRLDTALTDSEADRFRVAYAAAAPSKLRQLEELAHCRNHRQRSAFFFGLTAFEQDFRGLNRYVDTRMGDLTSAQQRILIFLSIAHYYGQQSVPAQAFTLLLGLPQSRMFNMSSAFTDSATQALDLVIANQNGEWRTAHHFIALEIMQQVLAADSQEPSEVWKQSLSLWGREFAEFCQDDHRPASDRLLELVRRVFIYRDNTDVLGTERAAVSHFAQFIEDIPSIHGRIDVLRHLTVVFPLEAHFHAHLGRLLSLSGEHDQALECVDYALSLQSSDQLLHHMRGMAIRQIMRARVAEDVSVTDLIDLAKEATSSFEEVRRLRPDQDQGYVSEVQMLIYLVDQVARRQGEVVRDLLARPTTEPFLRRALERAEDLLDRVYHLYSGEPPSRFVMECSARLQTFYGDYPSALQAWDNLMSSPGVAKPPVRRQIVWTILQRRGGSWKNVTSSETDRIRRLLEENLEERADDSTSLRLWLRAVRQSRTPPSLDSVIEKVSYWKTNSGALDAIYYLYTLHTLRALEGSSQAVGDAERALDECRAMARLRRDRTRSFEWIGAGKGISSLVHQSRLGAWTHDFWESFDALVQIEGRVSNIGGPQRGKVEMSGGIEAFFVPARSGLEGGRDQNILVRFYLGFSYDGPRAWKVERVGE